MRLLLSLLALVAIAASTPEPEHKADRTYLQKQKQVIQLLYQINQHIHSPELLKIADSYSIEEHHDDYKDPHVVHTFLDYYHNEHIHHDEIFSISYPHHAKHIKALFDLFYHAKDYETFHKTAAWARQHVHAALFVYTYTLAITHRHDTQGLVLPPIYEIYPHHFFNSEVIEKAQYHKQVHDVQKLDKSDANFHGYTIESNYSGWYLNLHPEQQELSYFLEDVGMNTANFYFHVHLPSWFNSETHGFKDIRRGELFLYRYRQLLARYYLERLSNGLGEVYTIDWDSSIDIPYTPSLVHPNGLHFPSRPEIHDLHEYLHSYDHSWTLVDLKVLEKRLYDAVDSGYVLGEHGNRISINDEHGLDTIGNILQHTNDSVNPHFYPSILGRMLQVLEHPYQPLDHHQHYPAALEYIGTCFRDPLSYSLMKHIEGFARKYLSHVKPYTKKDLELPGVEIEKVEVDELVTYMDHHYSDLSNAVFYGPHEDPSDFHIRVRQERLNHKPFTYKLHVKSDKDQEVAVKIFLGPKHDHHGHHINFEDGHVNFVELDHHVHHLKAGENLIERNSKEFPHYIQDLKSTGTLYKEVVDALERNEDFHVHHEQKPFLRPQRFMLPKGSEAGTTFQLFVHVYPHTHHHEGESPISKVVVDDYPYGYPLERVVKSEDTFKHLHNSHFHEVNIYHKDLKDVDASHHDH